MGINFYTLAEALKSIGHHERVAILDLLSNCKHKRMTVKDIYENFGLEQSIVSRHLGIMKRADILKKEIDGGKTFYSLATENEVCQYVTRLFKSDK